MISTTNAISDWWPTRVPSVILITSMHGETCTICSAFRFQLLLLSIRQNRKASDDMATVCSGRKRANIRRAAEPASSWLMAQYGSGRKRKNEAADNKENQAKRNLPRRRLFYVHESCHIVFAPVKRPLCFDFKSGEDPAAKLAMSDDDQRLHCTANDTNAASPVLYYFSGRPRLAKENDANLLSEGLRSSGTANWRAALINVDKKSGNTLLLCFFCVAEDRIKTKVAWTRVH